MVHILNGLIEMKKFQCSGCRGVASYQSERWPSIQLCYTCVSRVLTWLALSDLSDGNPFAIELAKGVFPKREWMGQHYYEAWGPSIYGDNSYSTYAINLERKFEDLS